MNDDDAPYTMATYVCDDGGEVSCISVAFPPAPGILDGHDWRAFQGIRLTGPPSDIGIAPCIVYGDGGFEMAGACSMELYNALPRWQQYGTIGVDDNE